MKFVILFILIIPSIALADLWKCGKVYSSLPSDSSCVLVKKASTKCLEGGFRKISAVKNEDGLVDEECPKGEVKKQPSIKTRYISEKFSVNKSNFSRQQEADEYEEEISEERKMGKLAVSDPQSFSNKLSEFDESDKEMFSAAAGNGMDLDEARKSFNALKRGEDPEDIDQD